jgi:hypothetical protein
MRLSEKAKINNPDLHRAVQGVTSPNFGDLHRQFGYTVTTLVHWWYYTVQTGAKAGPNCMDWQSALGKPYLEQQLVQHYQDFLDGKVNKVVFLTSSKNKNNHRNKGGMALVVTEKSVRIGSVEQLPTDDQITLARMKEEVKILAAQPKNVSPYEADLLAARAKRQARLLASTPNGPRNSPPWVTPQEYLQGHPVPSGGSLGGGTKELPSDNLGVTGSHSKGTG